MDFYASAASSEEDEEGEEDEENDVDDEGYDFDDDDAEETSDWDDESRVDSSVESLSLSDGPGVGNLSRRVHPLGFSVSLPPGWQIEAKNLQTITLKSGDGGSIAMIRGRAGVHDAARWLTNEVLRGEPIAANWKTVAFDRPSSVVTRAAFNLVDARGLQRLGGGFVLAGAGGSTAMVAVAPVGRYATERQLLADILYSFRLEQPGRMETDRTSTGDTAMRYVAWRDPQESAFTVEVPEGWRIAGGVFRPDLYGTRSGVSMVSSDGRQVVWLHDPALPRLFVHVSSMLRGLGQVQPNYVDYQDAPTFAAGYIRHRFGPAQIERVSPLPEIVGKLDKLGRAIGKPNEVNTAAAVEFKLSDGRVGLINVAVSLLPNGFDDGGSWSVAEMCGFVSPVEEAAVTSAVMQKALSSFAVDPRWFAAELKDNRAAGEMLTQHRQEVAAIYSRIAEERQASQQRIAEQRGHLLAGTTRVVDAESGERFEVQAGSRYYFRNKTAEPQAGRPVAIGSDIDFNPSPGDFRRLLEIQPDGTAW